MNRVVLYRLVCACNIAGIAGAIDMKDMIKQNISWITKKRMIVSAGVSVAGLAMIWYMKKELDIRAKALNEKIKPLDENKGAHIKMIHKVTNDVFIMILNRYRKNVMYEFYSAEDIPSIAEQLMQGINFEEAAKIQDEFCRFILRHWTVVYNARSSMPIEQDDDCRKYATPLGLIFNLLNHIQDRLIYSDAFSRTTSDDVIATRLALVLFVLIMVKNFQLFYANDMEINRNNQAYIEKINAYIEKGYTLMAFEPLMRLSAKQMNTLRAIADQYCSNETRKEEFHGITWTFAAGISGLDKVFTLSKPVQL